MKCCDDAGWLRDQVARLEGELLRVRKDIERKDEELRLVREDFSPEAWERTLQELEQAQVANVALAAAGQKLRGELAEVGDHTDMIWDGALLLEWDAALSDTGEGRLEVREQARRTIEELFALADRIPAEVRRRTEDTLDALRRK